MAYLLVTLNHFRVVQSWAQSAGAKVNLDVSNFELEIKARNRVFVLYPQFFSIHENGGFGHSPVLSKNAEGFIGWLPYKPLSWDLATEKLTFKRFLEQNGEVGPGGWVDTDRIPTDFLFKRSRGSFGYELSGPYPSSIDASSVRAAAASTGRHSDSTLFAEQFIAGDNLKVWFWGTNPIYAHLHPYPTIEGDGVSAVSTLLERRLAQVQRTFDESPDMMVTRSALEYQGVRLDEVLSIGRKIWIDYRYGRRYSRDPKSVGEDNALHRLPVSAQQQIVRLGRKLGDEMVRRLSAPVLYSLDGVLDPDGKVWWLEMNSNPVMPPTGYPVMFQDLFGVPAGAEFEPRMSAVEFARANGSAARSVPTAERPPELVTLS